MIKQSQKKIIVIAAVLAVTAGAGYYLLVMRKSSPANTPAPIAGAAESGDGANAAASATAPSVVPLSDLKLNLPSGWKLSNQSDAGVDIRFAYTKTTATLKVEKCETADIGSCFGPARSNYAKTDNGGIYDLTSTATVASFGLDLGDAQNPRLYRVSYDFGAHQYSQPEHKMIRSALMSAELR